MEVAFRIGGKNLLMKMKFPPTTVQFITWYDGMECDDLTAEISGDTQLTACVRCPGLSNIEEEFLYYRRLIATTAGEIKIKYICFSVRKI
jgi:hypothetical protein